MASVLRAYNSFLQRRPMFAQCATSGTLFGLSDVVAQQVVEKRGLTHHDLTRTLRATFYGGCLFGPAVTKWFQFLNRLQFATPRKAVMYRVYMDQFLFAPVVIGFYFGSMTLMEGNGVSEAVSRIEKAYVPTVLRNWAVFVPTQIINFAFVPHHLRVLTIGIVSLFWNTYLSMVNNGTKQVVEHEELVDEKSAAIASDVD